jgi:hypothetical protein
VLRPALLLRMLLGCPVPAAESRACMLLLLVADCLQVAAGCRL